MSSPDLGSQKTFLCPIGLTNKKKHKQKRHTDHKSSSALMNVAKHRSPTSNHCHTTSPEIFNRALPDSGIGHGYKFVVKQTYIACSPAELSVQNNEIVVLVHQKNRNWYLVMNHRGTKGYVPSNLLQPLCDDTVKRKKRPPAVRPPASHTTASSDMHSQDSLLHHSMVVRCPSPRGDAVVESASHQELAHNNENSTHFLTTSMSNFRLSHQPSHISGSAQALTGFHRHKSGSHTMTPTRINNCGGCPCKSCVKRGSTLAGEALDDMRHSSSTHHGSCQRYTDHCLGCSDCRASKERCFGLGDTMTPPRMHEHGPPFSQTQHRKIHRHDTDMHTSRLHTRSPHNVLSCMSTTCGQHDCHRFFTSRHISSSSESHHRGHRHHHSVHQSNTRFSHDINDHCCHFMNRAPLSPRHSPVTDQFDIPCACTMDSCSKNFSRSLHAQSLHSRDLPHREPFTRRALGKYLVLFNFIQQGENEINVCRGEYVNLLNDSDRNWSYIERKDKEQGFVPAVFIFPIDHLYSSQSGNGTRKGAISRCTSGDKNSISSKHNIYQNHPMIHYNSALATSSEAGELLGRLTVESLSSPISAYPHGIYARENGLSRRNSVLS